MATPDNPSQPQYSLLVNGTDYTSYMQDSQWSITQNWSRQGDTATFYLVDEHTDAPESLHIIIPPLATIVFTDTVLNQVLFSGVVTMPIMKYQGPNLATWQLQCSDWTYLADRSVVFGDFKTISADQVIKTLVAQSQCGITTKNVMPGPMLNRIQFSYLTLSQCWTKVAKYCSLVSTYGWYVDENHDLHFYNQTQAQNSGVFFSDNPNDFQSGTWVPSTGNYKSDMYYQWDATSIRNSAIVRGANYTNTQSDVWLSDGTQSAFQLTYTPDTSNFKPTFTVGGVTKTVSVQTGTSATTQWVVVQSDNGVWSLLPNTDPIPAANTVVALSYAYIVPVQSQAQDLGSITKFHSLPNGGQFAVYIADSSLNSLTTAQGRALREIHTYAFPQERFVLNTSETFTGHIRAGQVCTFKSKWAPDSNNGNLPGINDTFFVVQNRIQGTLVGYRTYQITGVRVSVGGGP